MRLSAIHQDVPANVLFSSISKVDIDVQICFPVDTNKEVN